MRKRRWIELLSDYDCEIRYHLGKANVVADALSRKEREKPLGVRSLVLTDHKELIQQILEAQVESLEADTQETDKNQSKNDKTKHKVEKIRRDKVIRSRKSKVKARCQQKSTPRISKSTPTKPKQKNEENKT
uniref:Reverse transcriptase domain-containing protein n=1 Tax=Tanacetum cinerariifolium TaxID=118510 RepID=A0A6L2NWW0_TANCI|nr:reverse transcriptase domain-containing protein [Tanacetum cinerariifolium]